MRSLLAIAVTIHALTIHLVAGQQSCTSGFISLSELETLAMCSISRPECYHLPLQQRLIPAISFTCRGIITKWIFGASFDSGESQVPELQIWRLQTGTTYTKVGSCSIQNTVSENSSRVYECIPSSQLRFEAGDVLGIFQSSDSRLSVYYDVTPTQSLPTNYAEIADNAATFFDIEGAFTEPEQGLPLVTVEILVECGSLTDPENGRVTLTGTTEGSTANYSCNTGYSLMGVSMRTCQSDGMWSDQPPICTYSRETGIGLKVIIIIVAATVITLLLLLLFISLLIVGIRRKCLLKQKLQNTFPQVDQENTDLHSSSIHSAIEILSDGSTTQLTANAGTSYGSMTSSFVDKACNQALAGALEAYFAPNYCTMPRCEDLSLDITNGNILELQELGTGQFSQVILARTVGLSPKDLKLSVTDDDKTKSLLVAVKKLKPNATQEQREVFENECKLMARLKDNNVVHFMGVCKSNTPFIMMEYMENGDLNHYLQRFASVIPIPTIHPLRNGQITTSALLYMSTQIASAMKYLASCNIVHRDLAARNCLVGQDYMVKLADFGLSRNLYQSHYYHLHGHAILPIRWMASECFRGKFSQKSDVWAFGVTMWEMYTLAKQQPYHALNNEEVMQDTRRGEKRSLLAQPSTCPTDVYEVMLKCWHHDRHKRATFEQIHTLLLAAREYDIVTVEESYGASLHSELVSGDKFVPSKLQLTSDSANSCEALTQYEDVQRYQAVQEYETVQQSIQQYQQHQRAEKVRHYQTVQHYEKVQHYQTVQQYEEVQPYQRVQQYEEVQPYQRVQQYEEVQPYQRVQQYERVQPYETVAQHKPHLNHMEALTLHSDVGTIN